MSIQYKSDIKPEAATIAELYRLARLRRPVDDLERIDQMYAGSNLIGSAWVGDRLIGILRGWTDGVFDGYVCDLAVHPEFQSQGVGTALLDQARCVGPQVQFVLRASQIAKTYYARLGWQSITNGWFYQRQF